MTQVGPNPVTPVVVAGRYQLGQAVGRGGMADVHAGTDLRLGREVAVKIMRADLARDPVFRARFEREAQHVAAMNHPGIVAVFDTGELTAPDGVGLPYIVMEYVSGATLRDLVRMHGPMPPERACAVMGEVCAALHYSHESGLVHRDVKPANVMITPDDAVKVMDFGIARAISQTRTGLTGNDAVIGTAQYLAPEQGLGKNIDARADVYAAGCVLFELLTGEPPFTGDSPLSIVYQHVREDASPPSTRVPSVPGDVDAIVLHALAKNPDNRYDSAEAMRADLARVVAGQRPLAPAVLGASDATTEEHSAEGPSTGEWTPRWASDTGPQTSTRTGARTGALPATGAHAAPVAAPRRGRRLLLAGLALLLLVGGAGAWWWGPGSHSTVPRLVGLGQPEAVRALTDAGLTSTVAPVASSPEEAGRVLAATPDAGQSVRDGAVVTLRVGQGPRVVQVPSLRGRTPEAARREAERVGLVLTPVPQLRVTDDASEVGQVIGQDPVPGTLRAPGTAIELVVGQKRPTLQVPDVTGQDRATAVSTLQGVRLEVTVQEVTSTLPAGRVVATRPGGGTTVPERSSVTIDVSRGAPAAGPTSSPSTTGRSDRGGEGSGSDDSGSDGEDESGGAGGGSGGGSGGLLGPLF